MIKKLIFYSLAVCLGLQANARENFKIKFDTVLRFPEEDKLPNRLQNSEVIMENYEPDLPIICELNSPDGANIPLNPFQFISPDFERNIFQNQYMSFLNRSIIRDDSEGEEFSQFIRISLYNFSNYLHVSLKLQTNQTLSTDHFISNKKLWILGSNIVDTALHLRSDNDSHRKYQLFVFYHLGQKIKTNTIENSLYINIETKSLANGLYYCILADQSQEPLKFIVAH